MKSHRRTDGMRDGVALSSLQLTAPVRALYSQRHKVFSKSAGLRGLQLYCLRRTRMMLRRIRASGTVFTVTATLSITAMIADDGNGQVPFLDGHLIAVG